MRVDKDGFYVFEGDPENPERWRLDDDEIERALDGLDEARRRLRIARGQTEGDQ